MAHLKEVRDLNEKERLRALLKAQIEVQCALNRDIGKNIHKLVKLEGLVK